jgi:hypothetical protein
MSPGVNGGSKRSCNSSVNDGAGAALNDETNTSMYSLYICNYISIKLVRCSFPSTFVCCLN